MDEMKGDEKVRRMLRRRLVIVITAVLCSAQLLAHLRI
jgi:hypothetical protein